MNVFNGALSPLRLPLSIKKPRYYNRISYEISCFKRFLSHKNNDSNKVSTELKMPEDYDVNKVTKEDLIWRKSWNEETKQYFKTLRVFYSESNNVEMTRFLHSPLKLSSMINWFKNRGKEKDIIMQSYIPERNQILGNELAAAHFVVFRGGAVKFYDSDKWIKADENGDYDLPNNFVKNQYLEAIDCSNMILYYEGLQNFRKLQHVTWLSLNGCANIDDWCVDQICGMFYDSLVYLDLRNCPAITERGLVSLWKMENLKILYLDDVLRSSSYEMTILLLEEYLPHLEIRVGDFAEKD